VDFSVSQHLSLQSGKERAAQTVREESDVLREGEVKKQYFWGDPQGLNLERKRVERGLPLGLYLLYLQSRVPVRGAAEREGGYAACFLRSLRCNVL